MSRLAFTLVEVAACLVVAGLVAAAATLSLRGVGSIARMDDAIAGVQQHLARIRDQAARFDRPGHVVFDLGEHTIAVEAPPEAGGAVVNAQPLQLPSGFRLAAVRTGETTVTERRLALRVSSRGHMPTLAVRLDGSLDQSRWLVVTGLTGQAATFDTEPDVERCFAILAPPQFSESPDSPESSRRADFGGDDAR